MSGRGGRGSGRGGRGRGRGSVSIKQEPGTSGVRGLYSIVESIGLGSL